MKMKLGKLSSDGFVKAHQKMMTLSGVPVKGLLSLRSNAKAVSDELAKYEELRKKIVTELALKDEAGNVVTEKAGQGEVVVIQEDKRIECATKLVELSSTEVDIPEVKIGDLGTNPSLNGEDLYHLEFITE